jgi:hypothetical protein
MVSYMSDNSLVSSPYPERSSDDELSGLGHSNTIPLIELEQTSELEYIESPTIIIEEVESEGHLANQ